MPYVGAPISGVLNSRLVAGRGEYTADVSLPDMGHMAVVRSPYAHARIVSVDGSGAAALPGVRAVVTAEDVRKRTGPITPFLDPRAFGGNGTEVYCLALDRVRYVGEPVAAVVADDRYTAAEAAQLVRAEYEELSPVVDGERALAPGAPLLYPEWGTNEMLHLR